jgi:hypothetical protein
VFQASPIGDGDTCMRCGKPRNQHTLQVLDSWATCCSVLTNAIKKLANGDKLTSSFKGGLVVYRGVREDRIRLPETFYKPCEDGETPGGVELGLMSTSFDREIASDYAQRPGSVMEIKLDRYTRGASLKFLSYYSAEEEMLFPPGQWASSQYFVANVSQ